MTCRCPMCGVKNAGKNNVRNSYLRVGLRCDEHGLYGAAKSKKHTRKIRRLREKQQLRREIAFL